jgi:hypothetical protein
MPRRGGHHRHKMDGGGYEPGGGSSSYRESSVIPGTMDWQKTFATWSAKEQAERAGAYEHTKQSRAPAKPSSSSSLEQARSAAKERLGSQYPGLGTK